MAITDLLARAHQTGTHTGICGQAPSDHPGLARFLVDHGIESISVSPDSFLAVKRVVAQIEQERDRDYRARGARESGAEMTE